jgi:hypothetical protein
VHAPAKSRMYPRTVGGTAHVLATPAREARRWMVAAVAARGRRE